MSKILDMVHGTAKDLHEAGVMDGVTLREFDALCLPQLKNFTPDQIKKLRLKYKLSQAVFALYLNTSLSTIQSWEQGKKSPKGASMKLLNIVDRKRA